VRFGRQAFEVLLRAVTVVCGRFAFGFPFVVGTREERKAAFAILNELERIEVRGNREGASWSFARRRRYCRKRYARLRQGSVEINGVICVPWTDAFPERLGERIGVEWGADPGAAKTFWVNGRDGKIDDSCA